MSEVTLVTLRGRLARVVGFARAAEPRTALSRRSLRNDFVVAAVLFAAALASCWRPLPPLAAACLVTSAPLAFRRRFPLAAFGVLMVAVLVTRRYATDITFVAVVLGAYSAVVHSRYRGAALLAMAPAGVAVTAAFWNVAPLIGPRGAVAGLRAALGMGHVQPPGVRPVSVRPVPLEAIPVHIPGLMILPVTPTAPWRLTATLVLVSLVSIAIVGTVVSVGDRIRRLNAEHADATRRALEMERARIASELHDVVTHNVSVMIVQAGAARQVLADAPDEARTAMLAVESSGRAAMTELRHLLGLLSPSATPEAEPPGEAVLARRAPGHAAPGRHGPGADTRHGGEGADGFGGHGGQSLAPQPGLGQVTALADRVRAAGLPVGLRVGDLPPDLPPGVDLAAFRVVQEALTNVLKHAGRPRTSVSVDHREGSLTVEVTNAARQPGGLVATGGPSVPGGGRGLLGLRERTALYGGDLEAGPRPGGGWRVRARIPVDVTASGRSRDGGHAACPPPRAQAPSLLTVRG